MAGERINMAGEGSVPGEGGPPGQPQPGVSQGAAEAWSVTWGGKNPLESVRGQLVDIPDWAEEEGRRTTSDFGAVREQYELLSRVNPARLTADQQVELQTLRGNLRGEILQFRTDLENEPVAINARGENVVLEHVRNAALKFYKKVMSVKTNESYGQDREALIVSGRSGREYQETIFDDSPQLKELRGKYGGLLNYIFDGIVQEIDQAEHNRSRENNLNPLGKDEYEKIKLQRDKDRTRERKYITRETYYGVIYQLSAENDKELPQAVLDFTKDQVFALSDTDSKGIDQEVQKIVSKVGELLEQNRIRLIEAGLDVPETNPEFLRAKALGEAIPRVLGYEKMLYKGGEEFAPQYKLDFAANFIGHDDAIYLENPKAALLMHLLTTYEDGRYWLGQRWDEEKADEGGMAEERREKIEQAITEYAATHELFLSDEMTRGLYLDENGDPIKGKDGLPIGAFAYRDRGNLEKRDLRYAFDDNIEELLLDPGNEKRQAIEATGDAEALKRHDVRVAVFRRIKTRLDNEQGLGGLTEEQRKNEIRRMIIEKMGEKTKDSFLAERSKEDSDKLAVARSNGDVAEYDRIIWQWVEDYNNYRIKLRLPKWYPCDWDRVRINIDRPTKVLDRGLSGDELMAMFELNPLQYKRTEGLTEEDKREYERDIAFKQDEARFGFQLARSYQVFHMQDTLQGGMRTRLTDSITGKYIGKLPDNNDPNHPNWEINRRLGLINDQGQVVDSNRKIARVFDIVQTRLQVAIEEEAAVISTAKREKEAAIASGDQVRIGEAIINLRDIIINSQFLATHILKELGLVEGKLPVWSYNFLDSATMDVFTKALADYGVEVGEYVGAEGEPGLPISHNSKKPFYEIMERGRRALKAEYDLAAREFMEGRFPAKDEAGRPARAIWMADSDFGTDIDPHNIDERNRIVNKGAVLGNRKITEPRFELPTSGGVIDYELVSTIGDLGFYSMLVWLGVTDIRSLHGYIKRRDEKEFHDHKYFDVMDPVQHAKAQAAAYVARRALTGGKLSEIAMASKTSGITPGFFNETFLRSIDISALLREWSAKELLAASGVKMNNTEKYVVLMKKWRGSGGKLSTAEENELERLRQLTYLDFDKMNRDMQKQLYDTTYGVMTYFLYYLQALKEVQQNRIGNAPRNYVYDVTLMSYELRRILRSARNKEKGIIVRHKFSPEAGSEIDLRMQEVILEDADYLYLKGYERDRLSREGAQILSKALTNEEKKDGYLIPDESKWLTLPEKIRKALENIRRRGLLDFMIEEGYQLYETDNRGRLVLLNADKAKRLGKKEREPNPIGKEIIGMKVPPLVQEQMANGNKKAQVQYVSVA